MAEAFYATFAAGDFPAMRTAFADDCMTATPAGTFDNDGHEAMGRAFLQAFPDMHIDVGRAVESGGEVYLSGRPDGPHGPDRRAPPV